MSLPTENTDGISEKCEALIHKLSDISDRKITKHRKLQCEELKSLIQVTQIPSICYMCMFIAYVNM